MPTERYRTTNALCLVLIKDNNVLLGRRANTTYHQGDYAFPSGHLEEGETICQAMIREAKEEIGIDLTPEQVSLVHVNHRMESDRPYIDFYFTAKEWSGEPAIQEPDKCDSLEWFPLTDLPPNILPYITPILTCIQKKQFYSEFIQK